MLVRRMRRAARRRGRVGIFVVGEVVQAGGSGSGGVLDGCCGFDMVKRFCRVVGRMNFLGDMSFITR